MKRIVVLGAGFAGLIAAVGAVRKLNELHISRDEISVTVVNRRSLAFDPRAQLRSPT